MTLGRFTSCATPRAFAQVRAPLSQLPSLCCPSSSSSSQISGKLRDTERSSPVRTAAVVPSTRELERRSRSAGRGVCKKQVLRTALRFRKLAAADCRQSLIATRDVRASYSAVRWTVLASSSRLLSLRHHHRHRWKEGEETHPLPTPLFVVVVVVDPVTECHFERRQVNLYYAMLACNVRPRLIQLQRPLKVTSRSLQRAGFPVCMLAR